MLRSAVFIWSLLVLAIHLPGLAQVQAQERAHQVVDFVDLPAELNFMQGSSCMMEFHEHWVIKVRPSSILKIVSEFHNSCSNDSLDLSEMKKPLPVKDINYEFSLLDPHLVLSGNEAFSGPGSMDKAVRDLQEDIIALIRTHYRISGLYEPAEQLLSVHFHEEWIFDPLKNTMEKQVKAITPVIWQRRQTTAGEPVLDGETGLPVYYKHNLEKINLRNP